MPYQNVLSLSKRGLTLKVLSKLLYAIAGMTRYMSALICGLSGKEYELITGFRSHYNLSWSIRHKLGIPSKSTNLRNYLQKLSDCGLHESIANIAQK